MRSDEAEFRKLLSNNHHSSKQIIFSRAPLVPYEKLVKISFAVATICQMLRNVEKTKSANI